MATIAFFLGTRVWKESDVSETLLAIASGKLTLQPSGAEQRLKYPDRKDVQEVRDENQKVDRIMAHVIIECISRKKPG